MLERLRAVISVDEIMTRYQVEEALFLGSVLGERLLCVPFSQ